MTRSGGNARMTSTSGTPRSRAICKVILRGFFSTAARMRSDSACWLCFMIDSLLFQHGVQEPEHLLGRPVVRQSQVVVDRGVVLALGRIRLGGNTCSL